MTKHRKAYKPAAMVALALLLVTVLAVSSACSCRIYSRKTFNFDAIVFEEVEESELANAITAVESRLGSSDLAVNGALGKVVDVINRIVGNYQYAYIQYLKDPSGNYKETYTRYSAMRTQAVSDYYGLLYKILQTNESLFGGDEEFKAEVIAMHQTMDDEYVALQADVTALQTQYNEIDASAGEAFANEAADILVRLVAKNNEIAQKSGADSYEQVAYADYGRTYDTEAAERMCSYVKEYIGPLLDDAYASVQEASNNISSISDAASLTNAARGADEIARNMSAVEAHAKEIGGYMSEPLAYMSECNLHYKATKAKDPNCTEGASTFWLAQYEAPYIYQYCSGGYSDLMTFVHEFGHFTAFYNLGGGASSDLDVAEIHSQANEMLFLPRLYEIYGNTVGDFLVKNELFDSLYWSVTMGCLLDEFQREIYSNTEVYSNADAINGLFESLMYEYNADGYGELLSANAGYDFNKYWWANVSHTFESPFYYISYAMSALPSLTIYEDGIEVSREVAIQEYNAIQAYGDGSISFEDVLTTAKVASPFFRTTVRDLATFLRSQF